MSIFQQTQYVLKAIGTRGIEHLLTKGKMYKTLHGIEEGIFEDRKYVTVMTDNLKMISFHLDRFDIIEEDIE